MVEAQRATFAKKLLRLISFLMILSIFALTIIIIGTVYLYKTQLKPNNSEEEWVYTLQVKGYQIPLSIPKVIMWATSPHIAPWLNGLKKNSSHGQYELLWEPNTDSLIISCNQCVNRIQGVGADHLVLERLELHIHQDNNQQLTGKIILGKTKPIELTWSGHFSSNQLSMDIEGTDIPIESVYQTLAPQIQELSSAQITGTFNIKAKASLPALSFSLTDIKTENFTVHGLGTERLISSSSKCGEEANVPMNHWLVRAVMSAEDQRFESHPGYDLTEIMNAFGQNHASESIVRGASTITQQTAKLLFTGSEKTIVRKMRELLYAVEMEQTLGKARIMQLYLDNAPWGTNRQGKFICGAQSAAQQYFGVRAKDLNPQQAVWLAAMLHSPMREAQNWRKTGHINLDRAIRIASFVRNAPNSGPRGRQKVINALKRNPSLGMKPTP